MTHRIQYALSMTQDFFWAAVGFLAPMGSSLGLLVLAAAVTVYEHEHADAYALGMGVLIILFGLRTAFRDHERKDDLRDHRMLRALTRLVEDAVAASETRLRQELSAVRATADEALAAAQRNHIDLPHGREDLP